MTTEKKKMVFSILFIIYILIVLKLTVFRFTVNYDEPHYNLTLFKDLIRIYKNAGLMAFLRLFLGNIGWFIPFGFLIPILLKKKSALTVVFLGFAFSFAIEISQFIFRKGVAELDDLVLNTFGAIIGYIFYIILSKYLYRKYS